MVSVYIDANVLVALFVPDALSARANALVGALSDPIVVSDLAALEVSSTIGRLVRGREMTAKAARQALANFDIWVKPNAWVEAAPSDVVTATVYTRRFDINLHGADALHVAIAARLGARLLTLDGKTRTNAKKVGVAVV